MRSLRTALLVVFVLSLLGSRATTSAWAQSVDRDNPDPIVDGLLSGQDSLRGQSFFYSFTAGPGETFVTVDASSDYSSGNLHLVLSDEDSRQLFDLPVLATTDGVHRTARFRLGRRETVQVQLIFGLTAGVRVSYKIQVSSSAAQTGLDSRGLPTTAAKIPSRPTGAKPPLPTVAVGATKTDHAGAVADAEDATGADLNRPIDDKWALIVGISKFHDTSLNLKYSAKDAQDLYQYLITDGHFAPDHVKLLVDEQATKVNFLRELGDKWLPRVAGPNDLALIFISSHGSPSQMDREGINYLIMADTDPNSLYATGLPLQDLAQTIKERVHCDRVVVIIDACHSGVATPTKGIVRLNNVNPDELLTGTGQIIVCSSEPSQVSWESARYQNGVFTRELITALHSHAPFIQAFDRMKEQVQAEVLQDRGEMQTPVLKTKWRGAALIISAPPAKPRPAPDLR